MFHLTTTTPTGPMQCKTESYNRAFKWLHDNAGRMDAAEFARLQAELERQRVRFNAELSGFKANLKGRF